MTLIFEFPPAFIDALFGLPPNIAQYVQQKRLDRTQVCANCPLLATTLEGTLECVADSDRYVPDVRDARMHCLTSSAYRGCPRFAEGSIEVKTVQ